MSKHNLRLQDPSNQLTQDYPRDESLAICDLLLGKPWNELVSRHYIVDLLGDGNFTISEDGRAVLAGQTFPALSGDALRAVELLHADLEKIGRQFREGDFKPAVAAAFILAENRLNDVRDLSQNQSVAGFAGPTLIRELYRFKILRSPYPSLPVAWQPGAEEGLKNILSGALGFVRNPYTHTPGSLPDLDEKSCLELLFFASFLLRMIDLSK